MEHRSRNYVDDPQCFVDMFLAKIDENPESPYFNGILIRTSHS